MKKKGGDGGGEKEEKEELGGKRRKKKEGEGSSKVKEMGQQVRCNAMQMVGQQVRCNANGSTGEVQCNAMPCKRCIVVKKKNNGDHPSQKNNKIKN